MLAAAITVALAAALGLVFVGRAWALRRQSRGRLRVPDEVALAADERDGPLRRWLRLAGYRSPSAPAAFVLGTLGLAGVGLGAVALLYAFGNLRQAARLIAMLPAGLGDIALPLAYALPWLAVVLLASLPALVVRSARRRRVARTEEDLPITLELLATLGEAGLGFDAALDRILGGQPAGRPLAEELRVFQVELLAGRPRVQCLRRLSARLGVPSLTVLVSALVQADQVGAGVADVLRRQSEDLRNHRRERALALAATLPVKLLFPLVICFLPGILLFTLGPTLHQLFQLLDGLFRNRGGLP